MPIFVTFGGDVSAGITNHASADPNVLEDVAGDSSQNNTEILVDTKEKAQVLDSPQPVEVQLLGADSSKR
jgi:hypothetical protein